MNTTSADLEDEPDRVQPGFACRACGEAALDNLEITEVEGGDRIRCATCGIEYAGAER